MRLDASIGIDEWERKTSQLIELDIEVAVETAGLLDSGDLSRGVDFTALVSIARERVQAGHVELAESLADQLATDILERTPALLVVVELRKFCPCGAAASHFGVRVTRARAGH
jgi:dihydroneopterin aldolase